MENLRIDHADGVSIAELALRHKLPADYIEMVLNAPVEDEAVTADESEE
jgi:precorrin-3B C17-methyltransferase